MLTLFMWLHFGELPQRSGMSAIQLCLGHSLSARPSLSDWNQETFVTSNAHWLNATCKSKYINSRVKRVNFM